LGDLSDLESDIYDENTFGSDSTKCSMTPLLFNHSDTSSLTKVVAISYYKDELNEVRRKLYEESDRNLKSLWRNKSLNNE